MTDIDADVDALTRQIDALTVVDAVASFWHAHGLSAVGVEHFGLRVVTNGAGRLFLRYPVVDQAGVIVTHRLSAVDAQPPRGGWDGPARHDLLYGLHFVLRGAPLLLVAAARHVWRLACLGVPAVCFLCGPEETPPAAAVAQIVDVDASAVLVIDDEEGLMPGGAMSVIAALRAAGQDTGGYQLPAAPWLRACGWDGMTMSDLAARADGDADHLYALVNALTPLSSERDSEEARHECA